MGAVSETKIKRINCRVFVDPTDLGAADYGGTEIGSVKAIAWQTGQRHVPIVAEEYGGPYDFARVEDAFIVACMLRQFDADALAAVFRSAATGGSGDPLVTFPAARNLSDDGLLASERRKVLFAPRKSDEPGLLLYSALCVEDDQDRVRMSLFREAAIPALFLGCKPSVGGNVAQWGRVEDMSL